MQEGVIKFVAQHGPGALPPEAQALVEPLLHWRRVMRERGMVGQEPGRYGGLGFGNLSVRLPPFPGAVGARRFLVTGSQTAGVADLGAAGLCVVERYDHAANRVVSVGGVLPSSEAMTHAMVYDLDVHARAVLHAHCPELWHAAARLGLPTTGPHADYGTPEMVQETERLFRETELRARRIFSMAGHQDGVVAFGSTLEEAGAVLLAALADVSRT